MTVIIIVMVNARNIREGAVIACNNPCYSADRGTCTVQW